MAAAPIGLDDEAMVALAAQVTHGIEAHLMDSFNQAIETQNVLIEGLTTQLAEIQEAEELSRVAVDGRLEALELDEAQKREIWTEDLPEDNTIRLSYRPRIETVENEPTNPKAALQAETDAVAEETLAKFEAR